MGTSRSQSRINSMTSKVISSLYDAFRAGAKLMREQQLPWRLAQWLAQRRQESLRRECDRRVDATRPFVTGADHPDFELHMLLGRKHVGMALWAVKSFLYATNLSFKVVLHDDGSLSFDDVTKLKAHLVGVDVVRKSEADVIMRQKLAAYPNCLEYRFTSRDTTDHRGTKYNMRIFSLRLFDFNLLSDSKKTLVLDADVLFFKEPREILEWATSPSDGISLYSVEQYLPVRDARNRIIRFDLKAPRPTAANAGLLCFDKQAFDLEVIDRWIGDHRDLMDKYATFEQAAYNHLIMRHGAATPLSDSYSFNYTDDHVSATHFAIKALFFENVPRLINALG